MANSENKRVDEPTGTELVGHEWDGIEELNTPLPRWWLWTFYITIAWALVYVVLYPAWPMISAATQGTLGWSSRGELAKEMSAAQAGRADVLARIQSTPIENLPNDPALMQQAVAGGDAAFRVNCVQCHGADAAGSPGYPNLNDDDWLWGGDLKAIEASIMHGIRWEGSEQTRSSVMPGFAGIWDDGQMNAVVQQALSFSGAGKSTPVGAELYEQNCVTCHGADGSGDRAQGAPALNDAIWLYGSDEADIRQQILAPRHGVMPGWKDRLDPATIKMLAAFVHSRGGGEATSQEAPTQAAEEAQDQEAQDQEALVEE